MIRKTIAFRVAFIFFMCLAVLPSTASAVTVNFSNTAVDYGKTHYIKGDAPDTVSISTDIVCLYSTSPVKESLPDPLYLVYWIKKGISLIAKKNIPIPTKSWGSIQTGDCVLVFPNRVRCTQTLDLNLSFSASNLKTGTYEVGMTLADDPDRPKIPYDSFSDDTDYDVFSGDIFFNQVAVNFTHFVLSSSPCADGYAFSSISGTSHILDYEPWWGDNLCTAIRQVNNGYIDLSVISGSADAGDLTGRISGFDVVFDRVTLNSAGAQYQSARFSLPESVTVHADKGGGNPDQISQICPRGEKFLTFGSGAFNASIQEVVLSDNSAEHYFHGYGLPFYLKPDAISFDMADPDQGLILTRPKPVYVHEFLAISGVVGDDDPRRTKGFPSNDILFANGGDSGLQARINQDGISTSDALGFSGADSRPLFFPRARISFNDLNVDIIDNMIVEDYQSGTPDITGIDMSFGRNCAGGPCGIGGDDYTYRLTPGVCHISPEGALYALSGPMPAPLEVPGSTEISWGGFDTAGTPTFERDDGDKPTVFVSSGFLIPDTDAIEKVLYGSYTWAEGEKYPILHSLHDENDSSARYGNGFYAGLNLGPEYLWQDQGNSNPVPGNGGFLHDQSPILVRFNGREDLIPMPTTPVTKYVLRPAGLTGVFNTDFENADDAPIEIYDYRFNFERFAFRQDKNILDDITLIEGYLTLNGLVGGPEGMQIDFLSLGLTCNGNLAGGSIDSEDQDGWPFYKDPSQGELWRENGGDGLPGDEDHLVDEGCELLYYWNMPVLLTGISFENASSDTTSGDCNSMPRELELVSRNQVHGVKRPVSMTARYMPNGTLKEQRITTAVDNVIDQPLGSEAQEPGFSTRLTKAYLNQISYNPTPQESQTNIPDAAGFAVLAGLVDVPLFDDASLCYELQNEDPRFTSLFSPYVFKDETGSDTDFDGIPDGYDEPLEQENVQANYWDKLSQPYGSVNEEVYPKFHYSWPRPGIIDLVFDAEYRRSIGGMSPRFEGFKKKQSLVKIIELDARPDFITPERTKLSFGMDAGLHNLEFDFLDIDNVPFGVDAFLNETLGGAFGPDVSLEDPFGQIANAEQKMHDLTGGNILDELGQALDGLLSTNLGQEIETFTQGLKNLQQGATLLQSVFIDPFKDLQAQLDLVLNSGADRIETLYDGDSFSLAPLMVYGDDILRQIAGQSGIPDPEQMNDLIDRFNSIQTRVAELIALLESAKSLLEAEGFTTPSSITGVINTHLTATNAAIGTLRTSLNSSLTEFTANLVDADSFMGYESDSSIAGVLARTVNAVMGVKTQLSSVDLELIAASIEAAAAAGGVSANISRDFSNIEDAQRSINRALNRLEETIAAADSHLAAQLNDHFNSGDLGDIFSNIFQDLGFDPTDIIRFNTAATDLVSTTIGDISAALAPLQALYQGMLSREGATPGNWSSMVSQGQEKLDLLSLAWDQIGFQEVFAQSRLGLLVTAPFVWTSSCIDSANCLTNIIAKLYDAAMSFIPSPSPTDVRSLIRNLVMNQNQIGTINNLLYSHFGYVSDEVDQVALQITDQVNRLLKVSLSAAESTIASAAGAASSSIPDDSDWGNIQSTAISGYGIVSQDEIERIHLDAEFDFSDYDFQAALDITAWNTEDGKTSCSMDTEEGAGNVDAVITAYDLSTKIMEQDVGLKQVSLGFTIKPVNNVMIPVGIFGNIYLRGTVDFQEIKVYDLGLEAGLGQYENYLGARGAGEFDDYQIKKLAFFFGKSCNFDVLTRLDPEVAEFIKKIEPFEGVYLRGAAEVPIYNSGCWFTLGVGADIGSWRLKNPDLKIGGILGGSAYGRLACMASLKGKVKIKGKQDESGFVFRGNAWAACGVGKCSPGSWDSISEARNDDWCKTADAKLKASYQNGKWAFKKPNVKCCY